MIDCRKVFNNDHTERAEKLRETAKTWFAFFDNATPDRGRLGHYASVINPIISRPTIRVGTCERIRTSSACVTWVAPIYDYATCVAIIIPELALWIDKGYFSKSTSRHMDELIAHYELQCPSTARFRRLNIQTAKDYEEEGNDYCD